MYRKTATIALLLLFLLFVGLGDKILPQPLSSASLKTRTALNQTLVGLFPTWKPKTKGYERTEKAIEETEKGASDNQK